MIKHEKRTKDQISEQIRSAIRTSTNYFGDGKTEKVGVSMTKPDMTYTVPELMRRSAQGLPLDKLGSHYGFGGDNVFPDIRAMDLTEVQEQFENLSHHIKKKEVDLAEKIKARKKERQDYADQRKAEQKVVAEFMKKQTQQPTDGIK